MQVSAELNILFTLNARYQNNADNLSFRKNNVYCLAQNGQKVRFSKPEEIPTLIVAVLEKFVTLYKDANTKEDLSYALSLFWIGFISIHPFSNGNGRTAKAYLRQKAKEKNFELASEMLDSILLTGKLQDDIQSINQLINEKLKRKDPLCQSH